MSESFTYECPIPPSYDPKQHEITGYLWKLTRQSDGEQLYLTKRTGTNELRLDDSIAPEEPLELTCLISYQPKIANEAQTPWSQPATLFPEPPFSLLLAAGMIGLAAIGRWRRGHVSS